MGGPFLPKKFQSIAISFINPIIPRNKLLHMLNLIKYHKSSEHNHKQRETNYPNKLNHEQRTQITHNRLNHIWIKQQKITQNRSNYLWIRQQRDAGIGHYICIPESKVLGRIRRADEILKPWWKSLWVKTII